VPAYVGVFTGSKPTLLDPADGNRWIGAGCAVLLHTSTPRIGYELVAARPDEHEDRAGASCCLAEAAAFRTIAAHAGGAAVWVEPLVDSPAPFGCVRFRIARRIHRRDQRGDVDAASPNEQPTRLSMSSALVDRVPVGSPDPSNQLGEARAGTQARCACALRSAAACDRYAPIELKEGRRRPYK
jgi:hypothetical protein